MPFGPEEKWELYNIVDDFSQSEDLADQYPEKLKELQRIFDQEARKYDVYPLDDNTLQRALPQHRPSLIEGQKKVTYYRENDAFMSCDIERHIFGPAILRNVA